MRNASIMKIFKAFDKLLKIATDEDLIPAKDLILQHVL